MCFLHTYLQYLCLPWTARYSSHCVYFAFTNIKCINLFRCKILDYSLIQILLTLVHSIFVWIKSRPCFWDVDKVLSLNVIWPMINNYCEVVLKTINIILNTFQHRFDFWSKIPSNLYIKINGAIWNLSSDTLFPSIQITLYIFHTVVI